MKTFRYKLGHEACRTMTVHELIGKLSEYPPDMPVFGEWEGVRGAIETDDFRVSEEHWGEVKDKCSCLMIDVENY